MVYKIDWKSLNFDRVNIMLNDSMVMAEVSAWQDMILTKITSVYATENKKGNSKWQHWAKLYIV